MRPATRRRVFWVAAPGLLGLAAWLTAPAGRLGGVGPAPRPAQQPRRPVGAIFLDGGRTLCVANQRSGTLCLVDLPRRRVRAEVPVGRHLTGLAALPGGKHLLVTDGERNELIALSVGGDLAVRARLGVGPYPAGVAVQPGGKRATVACLWSRRLEVVDLSALSAGKGRARLRVLHTLRLPFAPREQCVLPGGRVAVADAFGGHLAVVDVARGRLLACHELPGHNLRGLALAPGGKHLLISHQLLDQKAPATRDNLRRGRLMANVVRTLPLDALADPRADLNRVGRLVRLGSAGAGAGDPAGVAVLGRGGFAVALAGVNEVALVRAGGKEVRRVQVGLRPTAVLAGPGGAPLVVVNTFDDSLSLLDRARGVVVHTLALGPRPPASDADRGELLFYDARLSRDGWMSCHSCHTDGHTNGLLADTLGDDTFGTPKRTLTLRGTRLTDPWGWGGKFRYLHEQVRASLEQTMHAPSVTEDVVGDLTTFLSGLPPPPPAEPTPAGRADRARVERGRRAFEKHRCDHCHVPPVTYSSWEVHDVGLADERGLRKFNPPSLRGVGQGYRFLHDNRAATLEEVFTRYHHKLPADTPRSEVDDLVRFLRSL